MLNAATGGPDEPGTPSDPDAASGARLVLRGGRVVDPASGTDEIVDVVVSGGRVTAVGPGAGDEVVAASASVGLPPVEVVDCAGLVVTPGLIDLHAHVFPGLGDFCVEPDRAGVQTGVPVVVDGGHERRRHVHARPQLAGGRPRPPAVLAFMDPCQLYLATGDFICHKLRIADDERNLDLDVDRGRARRARRHGRRLQGAGHPHGRRRVTARSSRAPSRWRATSR